LLHSLAEGKTEDHQPDAGDRPGEYKNVKALILSCETAGLMTNQDASVSDINVYRLFFEKSLAKSKTLLSS
jgi:hypothetical protein